MHQYSFEQVTNILNACYYYLVGLISILLGKTGQDTNHSHQKMASPKILLKTLSAKKTPQSTCAMNIDQPVSSISLPSAPIVINTNPTSSSATMTTKTEEGNEKSI